jgi:PKD domain
VTARRVIMMLALGVLASLLVLAAPAAASAASRTPSGGRTPQDGSRFCRTVIRSGEMWTRPYNTSRVGRFALQTTLSCRTANALVGRFIAHGLSGLPHTGPRSAWHCRVTEQPLTGRETTCARYVRRHRSYIRFRPYYRFHPAILRGELVTFECAFLVGNFSETDRPVTASWDFGGIGAYDPDADVGIVPLGVSAIWVYDQPGTYTVTLTISDAQGNSARASESVTVREGAQVPCRHEAGA